jgi:hypothetical protein
MARRPIRKASPSAETSYPTLQEHLKSRRQFLGLAGASVATSGLLLACGGRNIGQSPPDGGVGPDARTRPDGEIGPDADTELMGDIAYPEYYLLRIPKTGDLVAYLMDGALCQFWVEVATYVAASYDALNADLDTAAERCRQTLVDFTHDELNTAQGVAAAEDDLVDAMDQLCQELLNHQDQTIEAVTLTITYLDPNGGMGGAPRSPDYP